MIGNIKCGVLIIIICDVNIIKNNLLHITGTIYHTNKKNIYMSNVE